MGGARRVVRISQSVRGRHAECAYLVDRAIKNPASTEEFAREMRDLEARLEFDAAARQQVCQCIWPVMDALKPEYRDALQAVDIEELSLRELADSGERRRAYRLQAWSQILFVLTIMVLGFLIFLIAF